MQDNVKSMVEDRKELNERFRDQRQLERIQKQKMIQETTAGILKRISRGESIGMQTVVLGENTKRAKLEKMLDDYANEPEPGGSAKKGKGIKLNE